MATAIMTDALQSTPTMNDKLLESYNVILLNISDKLDSNHLENLRHYCYGLIPIHVTKSMDILHTLDCKRRISWKDVHFLKEAMHKIGRIDIAEDLTEFEIKRDLTLLLDFYARKILELDLQCYSVSVKRVAGHLARLMDIVRDKVSIKVIGLTVESSKDIRKALIDFEDEIDCRELTFSWNEFTMLVIIAGEIIAAASLNDERREPVIELCFTAADELCSRMTELGDWEDFCDDVKKRYNSFYYHENNKSNPGLSLQRKRAEVVKQFVDTIFYPVQ